MTSNTHAHRSPAERSSPKTPPPLPGRHRNALAVLEMDRHGLARAGTPRSLFGNGYRMLSVAAGAFAVSIPLAFLTHWAYACWAAIPFVARVRHLADAARRRPRRAAA